MPSKETLSIELNAFAIEERRNLPSVSPPKVTAIIPAFNEAGRIGKVVAVVCQVETLSEIIIVDDGSTDGTGLEALHAAQSDPRLRIVRNKINRGKGEALFTGWRATQSPILVLLDADLINLTPQHVRDLIQPVLDGKADMTLGLFQGGYWRTTAAHQITPWLSGQRCLRADLMNFISSQAAAGYGFETALSLTARKRGWRLQRVALWDVSHPLGEIPRGGYHGPVVKMKMFFEIGRAWFLNLDQEKLFPRIARRVYLILLLIIALAFSLVNNFSTISSYLQNHIFSKLLHDDKIFLLLGKLKAAIELLH